MRLTLTVNREHREVDGLWEGVSLLYALREHLGLPGSKNACEQGEGGSCSVYLDGALVCACLVAAGQAAGREITTVEGIGGDSLDRVLGREGDRFRVRWGRSEDLVVCDPSVDPALVESAIESGARVTKRRNQRRRRKSRTRRRAIW